MEGTDSHRRVLQARSHTALASCWRDMMVADLERCEWMN